MNPVIPKFLLPTALRRLTPPTPGPFSGVLLEPGARVAVATDGSAIALIPFPADFQVERQTFIPAGDEPLEADATSGVPLPEDEKWGWEVVEDMTKESPPVYRIDLEPTRLMALCTAMGTGEVVTLEFRTSEIPVKITAGDCQARGYLMPAGGEGLLATRPEMPAAAAMPAPVIRAVEERGTLEITFGGKPERAILDSLKHPSLAFSYSGERGTRRGVPPRTWYGPDNPFTREKVSKILGTEITSQPSPLPA